MTRKEVMDRFGTNAGRKVLGCFPMHYPKELLTALDILGVEIWGPAGVGATAEMARIQAYVCPIARHSLEFIASPSGTAVDGLLFPHTCDSLQGLATVLSDFGPWKRPVFHFTHPKGPLSQPHERFLREEWRYLASQLEAFSGNTLTDTNLKAAVELHNRLDHLRKRIAGPDGAGLGTQRYELLRMGEYAWPAEYEKDLSKALNQETQALAPNTVRLLVSGIVPEPPALFDALDDAGAIPVFDDYAAIGRRITPVQNLPDDPWEAIMARYKALPPCPTRGDSIQDRIKWLESNAEHSSAEGILLHNITFCEPEMFDLPHIRKHFSALNLPVLYLETELSKELPGQAITRIEAFVEMVASTRGAK